MLQGRIQEFKKEGAFKRVHVERGEKFGVTTLFLIKTRLRELYKEQNTSLHARWIELHGDYTVAKLDWHASAECRTLAAGSNKEPVSRMNQQKGGLFEPNEPPPRSAPVLHTTLQKWGGGIFGYSRLYAPQMHGCMKSHNDLAVAIWRNSSAIIRSEFSHVCWYFLRNSGSKITCIVSGDRGQRETGWVYVLRGKRKC